MDQHYCQAEDLPAFSRRATGIEVAFYRLEWYLNNGGLCATIKRIPLSLLLRAERVLGLQSRASRRRPVDRENEILELQPGELVEVKSEKEIRNTLDANDRQRGLFFASGMTEYCKRRMRVLKRVERICLDDRPGEVRLLKHTVLLEGAMCNGTTVGCDRSCFYFWREAWLRRVNPNSELLPDHLDAKSLLG